MTEIRIFTLVEIHKRLQVEVEVVVVQIGWVIDFVDSNVQLVLVQVLSVEFQAYSSQQTDLALL